MKAPRPTQYHAGSERPVTRELTPEGLTSLFRVITNEQFRHQWAEHMAETLSHIDLLSDAQLQALLRIDFWQQKIWEANATYKASVRERIDRLWPRSPIVKIGRAIWNGIHALISDAPSRPEGLDVDEEDDIRKRMEIECKKQPGVSLFNKYAIIDNVLENYYGKRLRPNDPIRRYFEEK